jgi:hypothetical protein
MNNREALEDFRRRYQGTYAWVYLEAKNQEVVTLISAVQDDENSVGRITLSTSEFGELVMNMGSSEYQLKFKYPPVGVFQYGKDSCYFRRLPARQYQRGLCQANSHIATVTRNITSRGNPGFGLKLLQAAFAKETLSFPDALKLLETKKVRSASLTGNYSISQPVGTGNSPYILWHWASPVALVKQTGAISKVLEQAYTKQIEEIVSLRTGN